MRLRGGDRPLASPQDEAYYALLRLRGGRNERLAALTSSIKNRKVHGDKTVVDVARLLLKLRMATLAITIMLAGTESLSGLVHSGQ